MLVAAARCAKCCKKFVLSSTAVVGEAHSFSSLHPSSSLHPFFFLLCAQSTCSVEVEEEFWKNFGEGCVLRSLWAVWRGGIGAGRWRLRCLMRWGILANISRLFRY